MSNNELKIKGKGDTRDVYDGPLLIGHIHRKARKSMSMWVVMGKGATLRSYDDVWWVATWADGREVRWPHGSRVDATAMKTFTLRRSWPGLDAP